MPNYPLTCTNFIKDSDQGGYMCGGVLEETSRINDNRGMVSISRKCALCSMTWYNTEPDPMYEFKEKLDGYVASVANAFKNLVMFLAQREADEARRV
jgi:hypothetical protein